MLICPARRCEQGPGELRQHGVLRSNCIDCLDRTNVAQFALGLAALGRQLAALRVSDSATLSPRSSVASQLVDLYRAAGDTLALHLTAACKRVLTNMAATHSAR